MPFPSHIAKILEEHSIRADTKAALYDLYVAMGDQVLEVFSDLAEGRDPAALGPEATETIRHEVVRRYLRRNHPLWLQGKPTASLWHPRELEGRASGVVLPQGPLGAAAIEVVGADQPVPDGIVIVGRNAHFGGRQETVSFDVVDRDVDAAIALGTAAGQQHTVPGSAGETSATVDARHAMALIWEVQPNVFKPGEGRNREIAKIHRRHRNWHVLTLATAIEWLSRQKFSIFILRGEALAPTHEVNRNKPVGTSIVTHHDHTVARVVEAMGLVAGEVSDGDEFLLLESSVMNHALRQHVLQHGAAGAMWRVG